MSTNNKSKGSYYRNGHKIENLRYARTEENPDGVLECLCGWVGRAWDNPEFAGDEKDWPHHRKTAEPITVDFENQYGGLYATTNRRSKKKVAA